MTRRFEIVLGHAFFGLGFGFLAVALWSAVASTPPSGERLASLVILVTFGMAAAGVVMGVLNARNVPALLPAKARYSARRTLFYALGPILITALVALIVSFPPQ
ncbi:hypothetical protein [Mesorhizobium sp. 1M-11]|uniref:hypothetical protein n=1 Tax=Mesorhizobium sp. 1M-11 TaxID=1529006 RepID=UPI000AF7FA65|nr:hypothetical protein [Mesorhizobium sp. 1M-11]